MASSSTRPFVPEPDRAVASNLVAWLCWAMRMCSTSVSSPIPPFSPNRGTHDMAVMALVWLFSYQIPLALLPFTVYSVFHVATYTRANLIPTIQPPQQTPSSSSASPGGRSATKSSSPLADTIGRFVKEYYDASMTLVASLEIFLWFRVFFSAVIFTRGSWILLAVYTVFVRARYSQSSFVQGAVGQGVARVDALVANQSTPPAARQGWETVKRLGRQATDATDLSRYAGGQGGKKAQ